MTKQFQRSTKACIVSFSSLILTSSSVSASGLETFQKNLDGTAGTGGIKTTETELPQLVGAILQPLLGLLGILLVCYTIYGGYLWMSAQGEEKKVATAKLIIRNAIIGMVIILTSSVLVNFAISIIPQVAP